MNLLQRYLPLQASLTLFASLTFFSVCAQSTFPPVKLPVKKGTFFITYGYNRAIYDASNLELKGPGYDFTLKNVRAADEPTPFNGYELKHTYLNPAAFTIPQFNFHIGYYINDRWSVSVGWDHMKYVMRNNQAASISGYIQPQISSQNIETGKYAGVYDNTPFTITPEFLTFRHTNGFNYASVDLDYHHTVWQSASHANLALRSVEGVGAGVFVNRTLMSFLNIYQVNYWKPEGVGASGKLGLVFDFSRHFFMETGAKAGVSYLPAIATTGRPGESGTQIIYFLEGMGLVGVKF